MVQKEVKKKTRVYGTVALLSALILVSLIYVFGSTGFAPNLPGISPEISPMTSFVSYDALKTYLSTNSKGVSTYGGGPLDSRFFAGDSATMGGVPTLAPSVPSAINSESQGNSYSTTNIQVAGVDEADTTKNDGQYIYTASNDYSTGQNYVYIVKADPNDPRVIAKIPLDNNTYLAGMFLSQDSNQLVVIGSQYQVYALGAPIESGVAPSIAIAPNVYTNVETFLNIYDISDKAYPTLARNLTLSGSYFNSRMIGDYVYTVVSQSAYVYENVVPLPRVYTASGTAEIPATDIFYSEDADYTHVENNYFTFTSFYGLNLKALSQEPTNLTVLMGGASTMYVSFDNMYITYPTWSGDQFTSIYRVSINEGALAFEAKGNVPGSVLNQYSMDEYNGYFRLATTDWNDVTRNSVYVLNMNLTTAGYVELQNAEIRETIQSARFIGNKAYIVTFQQKDPFFVLDMSDPTEPRVAGKLEIPGYSSYLHPYDDNHVIGLGKEGQFVKLSLFDVSNVNAPTEIAKLIIDGEYSDSTTYDNSTGWPINGFEYSDSQALYEPKAFLFDKENGLLVIPMSTVKYGELSGTDTTYWGQTGYWEGAYVFKVTTIGGFELRGGITHQGTTNLYGDYNKQVNRALYINNTLYTVSQAVVKLNSLTNLAPIAEVNLS
jgi:inhibitor of cysteine peptidase